MAVRNLFDADGNGLQEGKAADGVVDIPEGQDIDRLILPAVVNLHHPPAQLRPVDDPCGDLDGPQPGRQADPVPVGDPERPGILRMDLGLGPGMNQAELFNILVPGVIEQRHARAGGEQKRIFLGPLPHVKGANILGDLGKAQIFQVS